MNKELLSKEKPLNKISLFNGMSIGRMSFEESNKRQGKYYACENNSYPNEATKIMFPDTIFLGDIYNWKEWDIDWSEIDFVSGGFPCQAWSVAGSQEGDKDERGKLFWVMLDVMAHVLKINPSAKILIENVKMKSDFEKYITKHTIEALGEIYKILINSERLSPQNRERFYWTNFEVTQPVRLEKELVVRDILDPESLEPIRPCSPFKSKGTGVCKQVANADDVNGNQAIKRVYSIDYKAPTLTTMGGGHREPKFLIPGTMTYKKANIREIMRLQMIPEKYINQLMESKLSLTQLKKMTGNAWTKTVIDHIIKFI